METALEQLYGLDVAVEAIPMSSKNALYQFLHWHKADFPPRYSARGWRGKRVLTASEILRIREMLYSVTSRGSSGRPRQRQRSIIDAIIARAAS